MAQITRHGNYGGPRAPYGSFTGKVENIVTISPADLGPIHEATYRRIEATATYRAIEAEPVYRRIEATQ